MLTMSASIDQITIQSRPSTSSISTLKTQRSASGLLSHPHVVRPVPVWIADNCGITKKTSMASLISSPDVSISNYDDLSSKLQSNGDKASESAPDEDEKSLLDHHHTHHDTPISTSPISKNTKSISHKSAYSNDSSLFLNTQHINSKFAYLQHDPTLASPDYLSHQNDTSNYSPNALPSLKNRPRTASATSRWTPFVNSTISGDLALPSTRVGIETLNKQTDLEGEWAGNIWDEESRKSLATSRKSNKLKNIFRSTDSKQAMHDHHLELEQYQKDSLSSSSRDNKSQQGYLENFSRARYFMSEQSREHWKPKLNSVLLNNPHVPLALRAINFILSVIALAVACNLFIKSQDALPGVNQEPSTIMAVCCQTTALVYLVYMIYDEYNGKPLGLREAQSKMRLMMLDLFFIIFSSANLSLAFYTMYDPLRFCHADSPTTTHTDADGSSTMLLAYNGSICSRQHVLATFLFLSLVSWVITFIISIFRLVERVAQ